MPNYRDLGDNINIILKKLKSITYIYFLVDINTIPIIIYFNTKPIEDIRYIFRG